MARPIKYNWEDIKKHYEAGMSQTDIVLEFECPKSSLSEWVKKWNNGIAHVNKNNSMVYIIQMENFDIYKIGIADNPKKRLKQLQVGNPYKLKIIDSFYKENAFESEQKIHKRFKKYR